MSVCNSSHFFYSCWDSDTESIDSATTTATTATSKTKTTTTTVVVDDDEDLKNDPDYVPPLAQRQRSLKKKFSGPMQDRWLKLTWPRLRRAMVQCLFQTGELYLRHASVQPFFLDSVCVALGFRSMHRFRSFSRFDGLRKCLLLALPVGERQAMALALCNILSRMHDSYRDRDLRPFEAVATIDLCSYAEFQYLLPILNEIQAVTRK
jgi:hypothetical protein